MAMAQGVLMALLMASLVGASWASKEAEGTSTSRQWDWLGPFPMGEHEQAVDVFCPALWGDGASDRLPSRNKSKYISEYVPGGYVSWQQHMADSSGVLNIQYQGLGRNPFFGWAIGEMNVQHDTCLILQVVGTVWSAYVDGASLSAAGKDVGLRKISDLPHGALLYLSKGSHKLFVKVKSTTASASFQFRSSPCGEPHGKLEVIKLLPGDWRVGHGKWSQGPPAYDLPDVVGNALFTDMVHVRVANVGQGWLRDVRMRVLATDLIAASQSEQTVSLAPNQRSVLFAPLALHPTNVSSVPQAACPLQVNLRIEHSGGREGWTDTSLRLRCRARDESFIFTFIDFDGSPQQAAARFPKSPCVASTKKDDTEVSEDDGCPVLLSMHGMDVTAQRQADAYRSKESLWVLAPHGRSTHSFFWQGPGHWNAEGALRALVIYSSMSNKTFKASSSRVIFTGHSNGGYGALMLAAQNPSRAIGLAPLAGMPSLGSSGREGTFASFPIADPNLDRILSLSSAQYQVELLAGNVAGIPFLARAGGSDEVISPHLTRRVARIVCGYRAKKSKSKESFCKLRELPGKPHWWWDTKSEMDGGVLDDSEMRDFWSLCVRKGKDNQTTTERMTCYDLSTCRSISGVFPLQALTIGQAISITVTKTAETIDITTNNLRRLKVDPIGSRTRINIDGTVFSTQAAALSYCRDSSADRSNPSRWFACYSAQEQGDSCSCCSERGQRPRESLGPMRNIFKRPLACIFSGGASASERDVQFEVCQMLSQNWFESGAGIMQMMSDIEFQQLRTHPSAKDFNLIVLGSPGQNLLSRELEALVPVNISKSSGSLAFQLGSCNFSGGGHGLTTLGPWGEGLFVLVMGQDLPSFHRAAHVLTDSLFETNHWQHRHGDYAIVGPRFGSHGVQGIVAAGFYGNQWEFLPEASYLSC